MTDYVRISVDKARTLLASKAPVMLLDMRDARAYCQGHDPRAIHLSDLNIRTLIRSTPKDVHMIICCDQGQASQERAQLLADFGFTHCYSVDGGYQAWQARRTHSEHFSRARIAAVAQ
ncbi:MAG TPA: thiosulfate sulfurtransferase GlpE [Pseudomonas sp.]|jgi:thiosulfate sulfurtransferase|uniref:thiosulfate sulfurtransferase GlpE n=1 Tax=Pseudomonas sp. TaxID=306 RepID=UPI002EDA4356